MPQLSTLVFRVNANAVASSSRLRVPLAISAVRAGYAPLSSGTRHFSATPRISSAAAPQRADDERVFYAPSQSSSQFQSQASSQAPSPAETSLPKPTTPYDRFRPVIDAFDAPIDLAVAYGSGVMAQANASGPAPLTDFIIVTPSAYDFHAANLRQHPSHYPLYARALGPRALAWMTEAFGAGMWYVTMVKFGDLEVKYGVISTPTLTRDLTCWTTLYVSGRLHKPVLTLKSSPHLSGALAANTRAALSLALIQLPPRPFTEMELWEGIAGISYSGDPRMSVPGAENPEKVRNIVRGAGVLQGFRSLYGPHLAGVGLRWAGDASENSASTSNSEKSEVSEVSEKSEMSGVSRQHQGSVDGSAPQWRGQGEALLDQPTTPEHYAALLASLPSNLRTNLARTFRPTIAGALVDQDVRAHRGERKASSVPAKDDPAFWLRLAREPGWRDMVSNEVRHVIRRPALTQSVKGLVTAGFSKSFVYSLAKFRKWLAAKRGKK